MKTDEYIAFLVSFALVGSLGVVLNLLVCLVYIRNSKFLDAANIFVFNVSCAAFLYCIMAIPVLVMSNARGTWLFGEAGCSAYGFLTGFFALSSMVHMAGAAKERYFTFHKLSNGGGGKLSKKTAVRWSAMIWCYALFWSSLPLLGWSSHVPEGIGTSCAVNWRSNQIEDVSYILCLMFACFILPAIAIIVFYCKSYRVILRFAKLANRNWGELSRIAQKSLCAERKMSKVTALITIGFVAGWIPYALMSLVSMFKPDLISDIGASIPAYIAKCWGCSTAIIHICINRKLRFSLKRLLLCKRAQAHPELDLTNNTTYHFSGPVDRQNILCAEEEEDDDNRAVREPSRVDVDIAVVSHISCQFVTSSV